MLFENLYPILFWSSSTTALIIATDTRLVVPMVCVLVAWDVLD
jgi:hypothetical protein